MISACIVIYKEEDRIRECLEQLQGIADEILVMHDGEPVDASVDIAREYTDQVFVGKRIGIAEPHRVELYNKAKGDYILIIDADERLSAELQKYLHSGEFAADALQVPWWEKDSRTGNIVKRKKHKTILFRKEHMHFIGFPQAEAFTTGMVTTLDNAPLVNEPGFSAISKASYKKQLPWIRIHAQYHLLQTHQIPQFQFDDYIDEWDARRSRIAKHPLAFGLAKAVYMAGVKLISLPLNIKENAASLVLSTLYPLLLGYYIFRFTHETQHTDASHNR